MTSQQESQPSSTTTPPHTYDRTHPDQQEISSILSNFNKDPTQLSVISLGKDGVLRNLNADREVLDAVRLSQRLVKAFLDRVPPDYRAQTPELEGVDGSGVPEEQLWNPDPGLLPPPMERNVKENMLRGLESGEGARAEGSEGRDGAT